MEPSSGSGPSRAAWLNPPELPTTASDSFKRSQGSSIPQPPMQSHSVFNHPSVTFSLTFNQFSHCQDSSTLALFSAEMEKQRYCAISNLSLNHRRDCRYYLALPLYSTCEDVCPNTTCILWVLVYSSCKTSEQSCPGGSWLYNSPHSVNLYSAVLPWFGRGVRAAS